MLRGADSENQDGEPNFGLAPSARGRPAQSSPTLPRLLREREGGGSERDFRAP
jgi:hypothetical protein